MASTSPRLRESKEAEEDVEAVVAHDDEHSLCEEDDVPVPPDGGWGWIIVLSSFICNFVVDGICYTFGVFLDSYVIHFNAGKGTVSWAGSLLAGIYLSCGPIVSALTNRFGCRTTCIVGSIFGSLSFIASTYSNSVTMLLITYGICGGIGFGLIYLPAIVSVGYYFEKRRALATGIAVCGSGFGTFVFAPVASAMLVAYDWKGANLILAGLILNCAVFGALMRPLPVPKKRKPLLQRMAEDKAMQMERGSLMGSSYFMVQLPDGSYEKRLKVPVNADPGVHSNLNIDELSSQQAPTLPTISETKNSSDPSASEDSDAVVDSTVVHKDKKDIKNSLLKDNIDDKTIEPEPTEDDKLIQDKLSGSRVSIAHGDSSVKRRSIASKGSVEALDDSNLSNGSRSTLNKSDLAKPLARKDVFYSGSITNLREFTSQKSLTSYRQSMTSLPRSPAKSMTQARTDPDQKVAGCCDTVTNLLDFSLMKDPVFLLLGFGNILGMLGFYVPYIYIIDAAKLKGISETDAPFLISIIGIINTVGRLLVGWLSDFPFVDSLFVTNVCIAVSGISVFCVPLCSDYISFCAVSAVFGLFSSAYIALTSIVLVDLLGIGQLTNAFGLLCFLRGISAIAGPPIAGSIFDYTQSYDISFYLGGTFLIVSSIVGFMVPAVRRLTARLKKRAEENKSSEMKELKSDDGCSPSKGSTKPVKV